MEHGETRRSRDPERVRRALAELPGDKGELVMERVRRIVCDPIRSRIVWALACGPLCVDDLARVVERTAAGTSQHLRVLRDLGIVESAKVGRARYYRLRPDGAGGRVIELLRAFQAEAA
jgi:DNA-binding transcriptional ArsR family regulator